jgi:membrane-associated protein
VVAGVAGMNYKRFLFYNIFGGIGWVVSMIGLGYLLPLAITPMLRPIFGDDFHVQDHVEKVIILVVLASISPGIIAWVRMKLVGKPTNPAAVPEETVA